MSLARALAADDDVALEALGSKGLLRRARRDAESGRASVLARGDDRATVEVDGARVEIDAGGAAAARCDCPASGACRHVLAAVLVLRAGDEGGASGPDASVGADDGRVAPDAAGAPVPATVACTPSAQDELLALAPSAPEAFAGASRASARALADSDPAPEVSDAGASCRVTFGDGASVTFVAGRGLEGAVCKAPARRVRALVAAAALVVRARAGVHDAFDEPAAPPRLDARFLDGAQAALLEAAAGTLRSGSALAADRLVDLAASARAEAAPRVAGALRALARQAALAPSRHVDFDAEAFLAGIARAHALLEAIRLVPLDPALTGAVRRDYADAAPLELAVLGARAWRSEAGGRGVTAYGHDRDGDRWHAVTHARAAGADPGFSPARAYAEPLWGAGSMAGMTGRRVRLPRPRIAPDGAIAAALPERATVLDDPPPVESLRDLAHERRSELLADVSGRLGAGLRRAARPVPALFRPARFGDVGFDELRQAHDWEAFDADGRVLRLELPDDAPGLVKDLYALGPSVAFVLVAAAVEGRGAVLRPVSLLLDGRRGIEFANLGLDRLPRPTRVARLRGATRGGLAARGGFARAPRTGVDRLLDRVAELAVDAVARGRSPEAGALADEADALGASTLAGALRDGATATGPIGAMRLIYLVDEMRLAAALSGRAA